MTGAISPDLSQETTKLGRILIFGEMQVQQACDVVEDVVSPDN